MRIYATRRECEILTYCLRQCIGNCIDADEMGEYSDLIGRIEGCAQLQSETDKTSYRRNKNEQK